MGCGGAKASRQKQPGVDNRGGGRERLRGREKDREREREHKPGGWMSFCLVCTKTASINGLV